MNITLTQNHVILEKDNKLLRDVLQEIAIDTNFNMSDYILWFNEDNTGNIQIINNQGSICELEDFLETAKTEEGYNFTSEELNCINDLITLMLDSLEKGILLIEYGC